MTRLPSLPVLDYVYWLVPWGYPSCFGRGSKTSPHYTPHVMKSTCLLSKVLGIALTTLLFVACSLTEFGRLHNQAVRDNPTGIELEIRTHGGRRHFSPGEPVEFEELYTSKFSDLWHAEILDGWNEVSVSDVVHITDGNTIWSQPREPRMGFICCNSRHVWLSLDPVRVPYKLFGSPSRVSPEAYVNPEWHTLHLPSKPGNYEIYVTTVRVFGRGYSTTTYLGRGVPVSSNALTLEVK